MGLDLEEMNIEKLIDFIKEREGFRSRVYKDHLGIDTVGWGFTIKDLELPKGVASTILRIIVLNRIIDIHNQFDWFNKMPSGVQMIIVEMCYQLGIEGFSKFKQTIEYLKGRKWIDASKEMLYSKWAEQTPERANLLSEKLGKIKD